MIRGARAATARSRRRHATSSAPQTSMAAPHVTGTVALMLEENPALTQAQAEATLESTAIPLAAGCRDVLPAVGAEPAEICWGADATGSGLLDAQAAVAATP